MSSPTPTSRQSQLENGGYVVYLSGVLAVGAWLTLLMPDCFRCYFRCVLVGCVAFGCRYVVIVTIGHHRKDGGYAVLASGDAAGSVVVGSSGAESVVAGSSDSFMSLILVNRRIESSGR